MSLPLLLLYFWKKCKYTFSTQSTFPTRSGRLLPQKVNYGIYICIGLFENVIKGSWDFQKLEVKKAPIKSNQTHHWALSYSCLLCSLKVWIPIWLYFFLITLFHHAFLLFIPSMSLTLLKKLLSF